MIRAPVQSSNIASIGYDSTTLTLEVEFNTGAVYQYFDVPPQVHEAFVVAESKGHYLASNIKGVYRYARS